MRVGSFPFPESRVTDSSRGLFGCGAPMCIREENWQGGGRGITCYVPFVFGLYGACWALKFSLLNWAGERPWLVHSVPILQHVLEDDQGGLKCGPPMPRTVEKQHLGFRAPGPHHLLQNLSALSRITLLGEKGVQFAFGVPPTPLLSRVLYLKTSLVLDIH